MEFFPKNMDAQLALQQTQNRLVQLEQKPIPSDYKEKKKREKEIERVKSLIKDLEIFLSLKSGLRVRNCDKQGIIEWIALTPGGLPQVWVRWDEGMLLPEQPSRLTVVEEVVVAEVLELESLTVEEERDLLHLERQIERAFYTAGKALAQIRDRRLYRFQYKSFEQYCLARFGFKRRHCYQLMSAAEVVENLMCAIGAQNPESFCREPQPNGEMRTNGAQNPEGEMCAIGLQNPEGEMCANGLQNSEGEMCANGLQNSEGFCREPQPNGEMSTNGLQILPTSERQVRALTQLSPEQQRQAWQEAIKAAGGKAPSGRIVADIVKKMTEYNDHSLILAHHLRLKVGVVVDITDPKPKINERLGRIAFVGENTVDVWVRDTELMEMRQYRLKHHQVEPVSWEQDEDVQALMARIQQLRDLPLDPFELEILYLLDRCVVLTPSEEEYLSLIEQKYLRAIYKEKKGK